MGQDFVELSELLQLLRRLIQAVQPLWIPPDLEEVVHMQVDQIGTLVSSCRLQGRREGGINRKSTSEKETRILEVRGMTWMYHNADVVSVVQREGAVHLQQVVLCPEEAFQVLRVEAHHHRNVVEATERRKSILKYRLRPGVHFTDFQNLMEKNAS